MQQGRGVDSQAIVQKAQQGPHAGIRDIILQAPADQFTGPPAGRVRVNAPGGEFFFQVRYEFRVH